MTVAELTYVESERNRVCDSLNLLKSRCVLITILYKYR